MALTLNSQGGLDPLPALEYDAIPFEERRLFCHHHARYLLVTTELVEFLRRLIGTKFAIEVGSGAGDLGRALNIPMYDNHMQTWPDVVEYYSITKQPLISYGDDVSEMDALEVVKKLKPDIVIGAWVTHWIDPEQPPPPGGGNMYGLKEDEILKHCGQYVMIGSEHVHQYKPILKLPHQTLDLPFIRSRRNDNRIWIWEGQK